MTLPDPTDALNPVRIEHRLTKVEEAILRLAEQIGNMVTQQREANGHTSRNESAIRLEGDERRRDTVALTDQLDRITDGIAERIKMEAAEKAGYLKGQESITVKMPWRQVFTIMGMVLGIIVSAEAAVRALM